MRQLTIQRTNASAVIAVLGLCTVFASIGNAKCGFSSTPNAAVAASAAKTIMARAGVRASSKPAGQVRGDGEASITGLWNVTFEQDGQVVAQAIELWSSDGTEILNDASAPASGNVCLGVWSRTAPLTYKLNHPSYAFDDAGVNLTGMVFILEQVKLAKDGNSFTGDVAIDFYDLSGNQVDHETGTVTGQRIVADEDPGKIAAGTPSS